MLVIFAGPAANIILAFVLFTGLYMTTGGKPTTTVDSIRAGSAAAALGLRAGDRIVSINGAPMTRKHDLPHDLRIERQAADAGRAP